MKLMPLISESYNKPLIVVDVQPAHSDSIDFTWELMEYLNKQKGKTLILFNGSDVGYDDDESSVKRFYLENGLDEDVLLEKRFIWKEKIFGYFRGWMDSGVDPKIIKRVLREMILKRVNDSRELNQEWLQQQLGIKFSVDTLDNLTIPDISIRLLHQFKNCYICGGGRSECLREITIFMNTLNFNYTELQRFIY